MMPRPALWGKPTVSPINHLNAVLRHGHEIMSHRMYMVVPLLVICVARAEAQTPRAGSSAEALPPAARAALASPGISWKSRRTPHAVVYAATGSAAERTLPVNADRAERAIAANLAFLGVRSGAAPLRIFLVGSREEMRPFTGGTPGGYSITAEGTAFLVANDSVRPALRHETMHLLSWRHWGTPGGMWVSEGLATLAAGPCHGQTPDQIVAAARMAGLFAPLDTLRTGFVAAREIGVVHYMESASLVQYIDRRFGRAKLKTFWSTGGLGGIRKSLGIDAAELESGWKASLARVAPKSSWPSLWAKINARGCE